MIEGDIVIHKLTGRSLIVVANDVGNGRMVVRDSYMVEHSISSNEVMPGVEREESAGMMHPSFSRVLPQLSCPCCGGDLKEFREKTSLGFALAYICDCWGFKRMVRKAISQ